MNPELLMMKGLISEMPEEDQEKIKKACEEIEEVVKKHGEMGLIAMGIVGATLAENI